ncbi:MAG TPA: glycosyltransferase family 4 protein, partial [Mycobacteriales bacterium]|nr:glycosyltransferase family 4 protein [Mycobacteriales bacterium]
IPTEVLPVVAEPVAVLLANWGWPPNRQALQRLLAQWPQVRRRVPDARLLLAGRGSTPSIDLPGVEVVGEVARTVDVLRRGAVMAFPCPPTSGPKMKVLDALAYGVPVVTTAAGVEGIGADTTGDTPGATVAAPQDFADVLAAVLADESQRRQLAAAGRQLVLDRHTPQRAAAARLALLSAR